jgi:hypothetical protein
MNNMTEAQVAWVAGIIEGEGTIVWADGRAKYAAVKVHMTDQDTVQRLHAWTGLGTVTDHRPRTDRHKASWLWSVQRQDEFLALAAAVEPWLMSRRTARLQEVRASLLAHREGVASRKASRYPAGEGVCKNGHDLSVAGVMPKYGNRCVQCHRDSARLAHQRKQTK